MSKNSYAVTEMIVAATLEKRPTHLSLFCLCMSSSSSKEWEKLYILFKR